MRDDFTARRPGLPSQKNTGAGVGAGTVGGGLCAADLAAVSCEGIDVVGAVA